ncbi:JmjC domain, hydroxylase-domain-containing protein [Zopfochytrium polystomum]|nr:JmjC domain, hydroxylase-domain-containing protein [Zopfochytrium polystomum]
MDDRRGNRKTKMPIAGATEKLSLPIWDPSGHKAGCYSADGDDAGLAASEPIIRRSDRCDVLHESATEHVQRCRGSGHLDFCPVRAPQWMETAPLLTSTSDDLLDAKGPEYVVPEYQFGESSSVPIFRPTMEQFRNFNAFITAIEPYGRKAGLVKVIPPVEWREQCVKDVSEKLESVHIQAPLEQSFNRCMLSQGVFRQTNIPSKKAFTVQEWYELCQTERYSTPRFGEDGKCRAFTSSRSHKRRRGDEKREQFVGESEASGTSPSVPVVTTTEMDAATSSQTVSLARSSTLPQEEIPNSPESLPSSDSSRPTAKRPRSAIQFNPGLSAPEFPLKYCSQLEELYWRDMLQNFPMYGADILGALFEDTEENSWNCAKLDTIVNRVCQDIPGVNRPYLYFGMWKATFAWHLEDMDLHSINYVHFGAPKFWYVIPPDLSQKFEILASREFPNSQNTCPAYLRHKTCIMRPSFLARKGVQVLKLVQYPGEFVITFPRGYHSGFNLGFNCAESVNFGTESWIPYGVQATVCRCFTDTVAVDVGKIFGAVPPSDGGQLVHIAPKAPKPAKPKPRVCALCPDSSQDDLLETELDDVYAHKTCALFVGETFIVSHPLKEGEDMVCGMESIPIDRWRLRCELCDAPKRRGERLRKRRRGACIQCAKPNCGRPFHVSCARESGMAMTETHELYCRKHQKHLTSRDKQIERSENGAGHQNVAMPEDANSPGIVETQGALVEHPIQDLEVVIG